MAASLSYCAGTGCQLTSTIFSAIHLSSTLSSFRLSSITIGTNLVLLFLLLFTFIFVLISLHMILDHHRSVANDLKSANYML